MSVKHTENFLGAFEKKVSALKVRFCQNIPVSFQFHFLKMKVVISKSGLAVSVPKNANISGTI